MQSFLSAAESTISVTLEVEVSFLLVPIFSFSRDGWGGGVMIDEKKENILWDYRLSRTRPECTAKFGSIGTEEGEKKKVLVREEEKETTPRTRNTETQDMYKLHS